MQRLGAPQSWTCEAPTFTWRMSDLPSTHSTKEEHDVSKNIQSDTALLFTAALLPMGNAAAANQNQNTFANSDVEAYIEEIPSTVWTKSRVIACIGRAGSTPAGCTSQKRLCCNLLRRAEALRTYPGIRQICHLPSGLGDLAMEPGDGDRCRNFQICSGRQPPVLSG